MFKINNKDNRTTSELTIKMPEWGEWRPFGVFIINAEYIPHLF